MKAIKTVLATLLLLTFFLTACQKDPVENKSPLVNAGRDTTYQLSSLLNDTITLSGSATDPDGDVAGYAWTQISGPNSTRILYPGSPSTPVVGVINGTYVFQLMATDNKGATGVKQVRITVQAPQSVTVTLQSNVNPQEVLLYFVGTNDQSDATTPELTAATWTVGGVLTHLRTYFKFDMTAIPAAAKIVSAQLTLYSNPTPRNGNLVDANYGTNNTMLIQRAASSWNNTLLWATQPPADVASQIVIPHTSQSRLDLLNVDVTNMVKDMKQSGNYGFLIRLQNEVLYNSRIFCSSRYSDATKRPKLVVQYAF